VSNKKGSPLKNPLFDPIHPLCGCPIKEQEQVFQNLLSPVVNIVVIPYLTIYFTTICDRSVTVILAPGALPGLALISPVWGQEQGFLLFTFIK
jgi:hypothetical protein